jgi:flagellin
MLSVNTNISALNAYQNLSKTQDAMNQSMQRLSSGFRINSAADDAAGLAISTGMGSQISGMTQAVRNTQDGISVVQTASGALNEATSILQRMRDLAVQSANDSNSGTSRADINTEVVQLQAELGRIASSTQFNGQNLLQGGSLTFQVGANNGGTNDAITVNLANLTSVASAVTTGGGTAFQIDTPTNVNGTYTPASAGPPVVAASGGMTFTSGTTTVTATTLGGAGTYKTVQSLADALNRDGDFAGSFTASVDKNNNLVVTALKGGAVSVTSPGTGVAAGNAVSGGINLSSNANAQTAIGTIDAQLQAVSTAQANLGAYQNRFTHTINNLNTAIQNTTASQSRIRDTDMASEMTNFSKSQILVQAGTAMLAQANQSSQSILKLLG